jgi:hypothetical protein
VTVRVTSYFALFGERRDSCADVDGDSADVVSADLDLAGVDAGADVEVDRVGGRDECLRATHRSCGTVEGGEHSVAG